MEKRSDIINCTRSISKRKEIGEDEYEDFKSFTTKNRYIKFDDDFGPATYKVRVKATAEKRLESDTTEVTINLGDRDKKITYKTLVDQYNLSLVQSLNMAVSLQMSSATYSSDFKEDGTEIVFDANAGTVSGRIQYDYRKHLGIVAYSEVGAFTINGENRSFFQNEASLVYVLSPRFGFNLRAGGGGFYKEIPFIQATVVSDTVEKDVIRYMGPLTYLEATQKFLGSYNIRAMGEVYWPMVGLITPDDQPLEWTASFKGGFL